MKTVIRATRLYFKTLIVILLSTLATHAQVDSLMKVLEIEMGRKAIYDSQKLSRIDMAKQLAGNASVNERQAFDYYLTVIEEFEKFSFDSTLFYIDKNIKIANALNDQTLLNEANLYLSSTLTAVGRSKEAEDVLKQIDSRHLDKELFVRYCHIAAKLYEDLSFYAITENSAGYYKELYGIYKDSLLNNLNSDSYVYLSIREKDLLDARELEKCLEVNTKILEKIKPDTKQYSVTTFHRSLIFELMGDLERQQENLLLSAISDIRASIKDNASLATLATILYKQDKIEKSHQYIQNAYEDAVFYNSRLRFFEISKTLSLITDSFQNLSDTQKSTLKNYLILISSLTVVLLITTILVFNQMKKLSQARNGLDKSNRELNIANQDLIAAKAKLEKLYLDLSESNHVKEQYIANFLKIHSDYIDKIDKYQKVVKKMLTSRKYDDLYKMVTSDEVIDAELKEFYAIFDKAFLSIYPDFINKFNELLIDEEKIVLKENEILNTELRIFALIRLGIKDSSNIARLLRYSVNTIYNYRVKMKNKSKVSRDDFENRIQEIDTFQNTSN